MIILSLLLSVLLPITVSILFYGFLSDREWMDIPLHSVIEALGGFTALSIAALVLLLQKNKKIPDYYIWVSSALVGIGMLDLFHSIAPPGDSFVWLHSMAVFAGGFLFALIWLPDRIAQSRLASILPALVFIFTTIFGIFSFAFSDILPAMISEGAFTSSARAINILGGLLFLLAAVYFVIRYRSGRSREDLLFINFCLLNGWSGLLFTFSQLWYGDWWFWHLLRLIAYFIIISYIFIAFQSEEKKLVQTNEALQAENIERKRAEKELDRFFNLSIDMFSVVGFDGYFKKLNIAWESTLGFTGDELKSKPFIEFVHPEDRKATIDELHKLRAGVVTVFFENRYLCRDGSYKCLAWTARPVVEESLVYAVARDVTERKSEEEKLRKSEERFRQIAESAGEWIWEVDADGLYTYSSPVVEKILGYKPQEIIGKKHFYDFFAPDVREELKEAAFENFARKESFRGFVNPSVHKNGNIVILETNGMPILDEGGNLSGYRGADTDITERRHAEEALKKERDKAQRYFDIAGTALVVIDADHKVSLINKKGCEILGYNENEIVGKNWFDTFIPQRIRYNIKAVFNKLMAGEVEPVEFYENPVLTKSGEERLIAWHNSILRDETGRIIAVLGSGEDITKYRRAEEALRRAKDELEMRVRERTAELAKTNENLKAEIKERKRVEEELRKRDRQQNAILNNIPDIAWLKDKESRFIAVNKPFAEACGVSPEDLIGKTDLDIWLHDLAQRYRTDDREVMETGRRKQVEEPLVDKEGKRTWIETIKTPIYDDKGEIIGTTGIARDITERKRTEEELRQRTAELARSNAELEQFAYIASHDLQEPLRMISGFTKLLERRCKGRLDTSADEFIAYIVDGAARMQRMIEDLLAYSRVGMRGKPFELTNLEAIFEEVMTNLKVAIEENKAQVTHDPLPTVMADTSQMVQLFQNLISNGIKFRREELPRIHVSAQRKGDELVFSVQDNGIGIAPQFMGQLFQLFQREHAATEYPGTGIGLAVCKKIVERHGGRIWAESEPGKGSTFYFTMPVRRGEGRSTIRSK
ncbi:MAG: PAS domain S-box protein [Candidatus Methanoperedens sp.]|nr:PAS domain S-box protein [Candidatus Methanoperedens nitroreducens]MDJ1422322.1 PAS domain S-box protein [Candidatus Methanoperedens sp.]